MKPLAVAPLFTGSYVNDLLCLPIFVPMSLLLQRLVGVRRHDGRPRGWEGVQHWLVFSIVFEGIVPRLPGFHSTADPLDVVAYAAGGAAWMLAGRCADWTRSRSAARV